MPTIWGSNSHTVKILIENSSYHLYNLGDIAMLQSAIHLLRKNLPEAELLVVTTDPERLKLFCQEATPLDAQRLANWQAAKIIPIPQRILPKFLLNYIRNKEDCYKFANPLRALKYARLCKRLSRGSAADFEDFFRIVRSADVVIASGGGYLNDIFTVQASGILHTLGVAQRLGIPTALFGQGIGPLQNPELFKRTKRVLSKAKFITLREAIQSKAFFKQAKLDFSKTVVTGDDALGLLTNSDDNTQQDHIGLNLRDTDYAGYSQSIVSQLKITLQDIHSKYKLPWVPTPVDISRDAGDEKAVRNLVSADTISNDYCPPRTPQDLIQLIATCKLVLTGSYHAAVFALSQGVPVCCLAKTAYYFAKFAGLQALFKNGVNIIDLGHPKLATKLLHSVDELMMFSPTSSERLRAKSKKMAASSAKCYADFVSNLS